MDPNILESLFSGLPKTVPQKNGKPPAISESGGAGVHGPMWRSRSSDFHLKEPGPSSYPLLGPKYPLLGTTYPQLRIQGGSWKEVASQFSEFSCNLALAC